MNPAFDEINYSILKKKKNKESLIHNIYISNRN